MDFFVDETARAYQRGIGKDRECQVWGLSITIDETRDPSWEQWNGNYTI